MSETEITVKYKGFTLRYCENDGKIEWEVLDSNQCIATSRNTLQNAKKYIDSLSKKEFTPFKVFVKCGWSQDALYKEVTVTSIDEEGQCWIKDASGRRTKEGKDELFLITPENKARISMIEAKENLREKTYREICQLQKALTTVKG